MTDEEWLPKFARIALHMPGFGGLSDFDALLPEQLDALLREVSEHMQRQSRALRYK